MTSEKLIAELSTTLQPVKSLRRPSVLALRFSAFLVVYAIITMMIQGVRPIASLPHPMVYGAELMALLAVIITSIIAAVHLLYPDYYQRKRFISWPFYALAFFVGMLLWQFTVFSPVQILPTHYEPSHSIECSLCVIGVAIIPSVMMLLLARTGASVRPRLLSGYAFLLAAALGCLLLRIVEANDDPMHLLLWHYFPTAGFAAIGAFLGKYFLKW
ncbi:MAG: NrsF family protein [Rickettsiales bacterium]